MNGRGARCNVSGRFVVRAACVLHLIAAAPLPGAGGVMGAQQVLPQLCPGVERMVVRPPQPVAGTLFTVHVPVSSSFTGAIGGKVAGEPLHFVRQGDTLVARAAVPIDSTSGISVFLDCADSTMPTQPFTERLSVRAGAYRLDKLTVAPAFSAPPDSALSARLARESARAAAVSRESHSTPPLWSEAFIAPRPGRITSGFGNGRTFNGTVTSRHMGTDFAGATGAPVQAINRGVVRLVDSFYLGGNVIYIDHGGGVVSAYLHLSKVLVAAGDTVSRGAQIGLVGATGRVTGPHLHLITRYGQITVDALSVIGTR